MLSRPSASLDHRARLAFEEAPQTCRAFREEPAGKRLCSVRDGIRPSGLPHICTFGEVVRTSMCGTPSPTIVGYPDAAVLLLRRHGRSAQGAGQYPEQGDRRGELGKPLTVIPILLEPTKASATTTMPAARILDSFRLSNMNSSRRLSGTSPAGSTRHF